jgi:gamma-glutamyltranspeptidase/glutathione hydrolase
MSRTQRTISKTPARGERGMVVSHNTESAEIGARILADGGTAFDAAVAMSFATTVREVPMNSVGGVGVLLAYSAATGETTEINFYGQTPQGLAEDTFVPYLQSAADNGGRTSFGWNPVQDARHERGALSVGVPGYVAGLAELHRRHATIAWPDLLTPAAELARRGFEPDELDTWAFAAHLNYLESFEETRRIFLSNGIPRPEGFYQGAAQHVAQPDLATTIETIAADGPDAFYRGPLAKVISDHVQANGGVLSADDFARFSPDVNSGLRGSYKGYEIVTSSGMTGGLTLLEMLNLAEQADLARYPRYSGQCLHLLLEIMRQAWTDRFVYVGDPEGATVPVDALIDKRYAAEVARRLPADRAPERTRPGDPWPYSALAPVGTAYAGDPGGNETTHLAAADGDGNVVTLTQTLGLAFGSCVIAPTTGALLYDVTMWMDPRPGRPNSVGPWKKQLGHATPVMVYKDGKPVAALGAPGGRRVVTAMFQTIVNLVDFGMDVQQAIAAPRMHCEGADPTEPIGPAVHSAVVDDMMPADAVADLAARGHALRLVYETGTQSFLAKPLGIQFAEDGSLIGGVDIYRASVGIGL